MAAHEMPINQPSEPPALLRSSVRRNPCPLPGWQRHTGQEGVIGPISDLGGALFLPVCVCEIPTTAPPDVVAYILLPPWTIVTTPAFLRGLMF